MGVVDGPGLFGLGCVNLGHVSYGGRRGGVRLVHKALDLGVRCFDAADSYGSGTSEEVIGRALRHRRHMTFLATKVGYRFKERTARERAARWLAGPVVGRRSPRMTTSRSNSKLGGPPSYTAQDFSAEYLRAALEDSLRRLDTDYVDLYQLHGPREVCGDEVLALMADLRSEGKIRGFGVGLESLDHAMDWLSTGAMSSIQVPFGVLDPAAGDTIIPAARERGVPVVVRGVFASGLLVSGSNRDDALMRVGQPELRSEVHALASSVGVDVMQLAAWFATKQPGVTTVLIGTTSMQHLEQSFRYVEAEPPDELLPILDALDNVIRPTDPSSSSAGAP